MIRPTLRHENKLLRQGYNLIAGVDEAGRGAWAGPLVAAAVILPSGRYIKGVNDSKKLSAPVREELYEKIVKQAVCYHVCVVSRSEIDRRGLGPANQSALRRSIVKLSAKPDFVLVDSFALELKNIPSKGIVKGDNKVVSIAAASIIAKVHRDRLMVRYHKQYPQYNFFRNKGYGTAEHRRNLLHHGVCPIHRLCFKPIINLG